MVIGMIWLQQAVVSNLKSQSTTQLSGSASKTLLSCVLSQSVLHVLEFFLENIHVGRGPWAGLQCVPSPSGGRPLKFQVNRPACSPQCLCRLFTLTSCCRSARGSQVISWELALHQVKLHSSKYTFLSWGSFSPFSFPLPPLPSPHDLSFQAGSFCVAQAGLEFPVLCLSLQVWSLWVCATMSSFRFCICFFGFLFFLTIWCVELKRGNHLKCITGNEKQNPCDFKGLLCSRNSMSETVRLVSGIQHPGSAGVYETTQHFMDIKEHLHVVKRDIDSLAQRSMVRSLCHGFELCHVLS